MIVGLLTAVIINLAPPSHRAEAPMALPSPKTRVTLTLPELKFPLQSIHLPAAKEPMFASNSNRLRFDSVSSEGLYSRWLIPTAITIALLGSFYLIYHSRGR